VAGITEALRIRGMQPEDIPGGDRLRALAGWNQTPADWRRVLRWEPNGCFVAEQGARIVGTVTTTTFDSDLAWIGMMLVDPEVRRQGIGRKLLGHALEWLEGTRRVRCVGLDATPVGKTLYDTMGFTDAYTLRRWQGVAPVVAAPPGVRPLEATEVMRLSTLDRRACGVERLRLIRDIVGAHPRSCFVLERATELAGYACSRPGALRWYIGPVVAADPEVAQALLNAVLAPIAGQHVALDLVDCNETACTFAQAADLRAVRPFIRMTRGGPLPVADLQAYVAIVGPEVG
jgi:GNAT superfamily N-acetyltransferase